jgi:AhpD family alkylhydroperoxidase
VEHNHEIQEALRGPAKELRSLIPEVLRGFVQLSVAAMAPGELSVGEKELIALSIATTRQCDGCIVAHAKNAAREGVSRQAVAEAMGVVIAMNGGPGTVYGPRALQAYDEAVAALA